MSLPMFRRKRREGKPPVSPVPWTYVRGFGALPSGKFWCDDSTFGRPSRSHPAASDPPCKRRHRGGRANPGGAEKSTQSLRSKLGQFCQKKISLLLSKSGNLRRSSDTTPPLATSCGQGSTDLFGTRRLLFFHHANEIVGSIFSRSCLP